MKRKPVPAVVKGTVGLLLGHMLPQCRFSRLILILGHMRCGSTALSNIMCSRPDISGQGESHIAYRGRRDLGILAASLRSRGVLDARAPFLFDKILHAQYDTDPDPRITDSRAIFLAREPAASIASIRALFERLDSRSYRTDLAAAEYYAGRIESLLALWQRFPAPRRIAFTHRQLIGDPEAALARISSRLAFDPPLENRYDPVGTPWRKGGGDPVNAGRFDRIETLRTAADAATPDIPKALLDRCDALYAQFAALEDDDNVR